MKFPVALGIAFALLLSGCPDKRLPKSPPRVPEPKVDTALSPALADSRHASGHTARRSA